MFPTLIPAIASVVPARSFRAIGLATIEASAAPGSHERYVRELAIGDERVSDEARPHNRIRHGRAAEAGLRLGDRPAARAAASGTRRIGARAAGRKLRAGWMFRKFARGSQAASRRRRRRGCGRESRVGDAVLGRECHIVALELPVRVREPVQPDELPEVTALTDECHWAFRSERGPLASVKDPESAGRALDRSYLPVDPPGVLTVVDRHGVRAAIRELRAESS